MAAGHGNFAALSERWPALAAAGAFADRHADSEPVAAAIQLRLFVEQLVKQLYRRWQLPLPGIGSNLFDLMKADLFARALPEPVIARLHALRRLGNDAAHGGEPSAEQVRLAVRQAHDVGRLLLVLVGQLPADTLPGYDPALAQEAEPSVAPASAPPAELEPLPAAEAVARAASAVELDEAGTRTELIDGLLLESGWRGNAIGREVPVGAERADYVLWDEDARPLAVVEAKCTARDPLAGAEQARRYADTLEIAYGQRPVIFLTNGYELWIWNDSPNAAGQSEAMRPVWGFYSRGSLRSLIARRAEAQPITAQPMPTSVHARAYQQEAVARVSERFDSGHRRALVVQATGTGKTRVAVAITERLLAAGQAKRVLFLCDRRELRKQARDAFAALLPAEPLRVVDARLPADPPERVFFATYQGMYDLYRAFDPGFFDLIIADESHRSLYNVYRELIEWFDARAVGLTATPLAALARNTFEMFGCENGRPTFSYPLDEAIAARWLVPYEVWEASTRFSREGLREDIFTAEQVRQLEEQGVDVQSLDYSSDELDRAVFNKDTNRQVLRTLAENGIRDANGAQLGKTIVFARSQRHAELLLRLWLEMYPQFGDAARVITSSVERADELLERFKDPADALRVAISVDMLDTGVDVPEIVNLVFARPVRSFVKFHQMIGRGTRLRQDLFGPGKDKTHFRIFDHWGNFERFGQQATAATADTAVPLLTRLFLTRVELLQAARSAGNAQAEAISSALIANDIADLDERSLPVRAKLRPKREAQNPGLFDRLTREDVALLREDIAPLMAWRPLPNPAAARFDLQITAVQRARVTGAAGAADLAAGVRERLAELPANLAQVQAQAALIGQATTLAWWDSADTAALETLRRSVRELMHLAAPVTTGGAPRVYDVTEDEGGLRLSRRGSGVSAVDMRRYEAEVNEELRHLFDTDPALRRLRAGEPVDQADIDRLVKLALVGRPSIDMAVLREFYGETDGLRAFLRQAVGVDPAALRDRFAAFAAAHPGLTGTQRRFLQLLEGQITRYGVIGVPALYEPPFTTIDQGGLDAIFPYETADAVVALIQPFAPFTQDNLQ
ncbi:DEAD/DEAH box helicase family protein [Sphingomonas sp. 2R-10]|uniref:DEAD/DEAH box helicase family protein n=1 Tax=Sphingomonas sp. 2R-10 TaxID=3045148 RepID=UPI0013DDB193|nr:DEAD/DEAH box helicase family protein [Sphingomonas sp. 2R-10]MDJ0275190.1 DEAD/DEAH box helicase family protein [Sphingomonas sp. 2R-10]